MIRTSVITDSTNQPVLNTSGVALRMNTNAANVRKSKIELTTPKTIMKFRINLMFQRLGLSTSSGSTRSVAIAIAGKSVRKLFSRICLGSNGKREEQCCSGHAEHVAVGAGGHVNVFERICKSLSAFLNSSQRPGLSRATLSSRLLWPRPQRCSQKFPRQMREVPKRR